MKKVLVFLEKSKIEPKGGPYGYNYNLFNGLNLFEKDIKFDTIDFQLEKSTIFKSLILAGIEKKLKFFRPYNIKQLEKYKNYNYIHFHTSVQMYKARKFLETFNGKVLFTSHSPMLLSKEMKEEASNISRILFSFFFRKLSIVDKYAFERADYIIFPCKEAEEPYFGEDVYNKAKKNKIFKYMPTGIVDCKEKVKLSLHDYRQQYNIPENAFVFSYVGRHNEVKGYGDLKKAAKVILKKYSNVYFLIGGKESPMKGIDDSRWIEIGYTKDPYSLINASDVFILPNKQTYFDLVFLEVISIGKKMIVSNTGGNKYFKKYNSKDIKFFNDVDDLIDKMEKDIDVFSNDSDTRDIFLNEFTCEMFARRYVELMNTLFK